MTLWNSLRFESHFLISKNFFSIICFHNIILEPNIVTIYVSCPWACFIHHVWNNAEIPVTSKLHWDGGVLVRTGHKTMNVNHWDQLILSGWEIVSKRSVWRKFWNGSVNNSTMLTWSHSDQFATLNVFFNIFKWGTWYLFGTFINWVENETIVTLLGLESSEPNLIVSMKFVIVKIFLWILNPNFIVIQNQ